MPTSARFPRRGAPLLGGMAPAFAALILLAGCPRVGDDEESGEVLLLASPTEVDFGEVEIGSSVEATVTLLNPNQADLAFSNFGIAEGAAEFSIGQAPAEIAGLGTATVTVWFAPDAEASVTDSLVAYVEGSTDPAVTVPLRGAGIGEVHDAVTVSPESVEFGDVTVGATAEAVLTVENHEAVDVALGTASFTDGTTGPFRISGTVPANVPAMGEAEIVVVFAPEETGRRDSTLQIAYGDDLTLSVPVGGAGVPDDGGGGGGGSSGGRDEGGPIVTITNPGDGAAYGEGAEVPLRAVAHDGETDEVDLTYRWESDLEGELASGHPDGGGFIVDAAPLGVGEHRLTLTVTDADGNRGWSEVAIVVGGEGGTGEPPTAEILGPADGSTFAPGEAVSFSGRIDDAEDPPGDLALRWRSDVDGVLHDARAEGDGTTSFSTDALSSGSHTITLSVTDSSGQTGAATVTLRVE